MNVIILAGGFAERMRPLTDNIPKQLLPVNKRPMLEYTLTKIIGIEGLDNIYITTNLKFKKPFEMFIENFTSTIEDKELELTLIIEDAVSESQKLGSIGALGKLINEQELEGQECLVIGGDNLFGFEFTDFMDFYDRKRSSVIALFDVGSLDKARLYGVVEVDQEQKIIKFTEKPADPKTTIVSTACYLFTPEGISSILQYLQEGNNPDAMGFFINWLYPKVDIYGYVFKGTWFDIGSIEVYHQADEHYSNF